MWVSSGLDEPYGIAVDVARDLYGANDFGNTIGEDNTSSGAAVDSSLVSSGLSSPIGVAYSSVPEPASVMLMVGSGAMLLLRRRRTAVV